ncbi:hypothetical protein Salat_2712700 [Sesamum alatum]|uniref:Retrovirus-related Pol polyprotein from transposon TNT 1-94-like beta-barrel domain-containing protein n=1 Tax=Sesamum alatum TaxID=300844 RepID=A0AAE1XR74_9LAMI|nr:hypothetical protein Salat_2712700 [Sesamum alatum]
MAKVEAKAGMVKISNINEKKKKKGGANQCRTDLSKEYGEKSNFAETTEEVCLMTECQGEESGKNVWYLDTTCSNHMSGDKSAFSNLDETYHHKVKLGDELRISIMGKGELLENGYELSFKGVACKIRDSRSILIAEAIRTENRMFPLYL